jgi:exodeoxyribonuclease III
MGCYVSWLGSRIDANSQLPTSNSQVVSILGELRAELGVWELGFGSSLLKIATWNVNGIRARQAEVQDLIDRERPDVLCLQEIKATVEQLPLWLCDMEGYWCYWHGGKGYSGVSLHVRRERWPDRPTFQHPPFDYENRIVTVQLPEIAIASIYVPNGGKDFPAKMRFLEAMDAYAAEHEAGATPLVLCGDLNVARTDMDVHPKERKPNATGQRPDERALLERIIGRGLVDVHRTLEPDNENLFTWWAPWRNMKARNIGWRLDYVLASRALAERAQSCVVQRETGTSDHGPVIAVFQS